MAVKDKQKIVIMGFSILIAFVLWLYVMGDNNPVQTKVISNIPVNLSNAQNIEQSNLAILPDQKFTVDITITGRALDVFNASLENFRAEADMSGYLKKGDNNIPVEIKSSPRGIQIVNKSGYTYIKVKLDLLVEKSVPIIINVIGNTKDGFGYVKPLPRPTESLVSGAATYVNMVASAFGQIDVTDNVTDLSGSIPIKALDKDGRVVSNTNIEPRYVDVFVPIKPAKLVPIVVKTYGKISTGKILKAVKPKIENILIMGDKKILDKIQRLETVNFDISGVNSSTTKEIKLDIPEGVLVFDDLKSINVDFIVDNKIEKTFSIPVSYINGNSIYNYSFSPEFVAITLDGGESLLNSTRSSDISAIVDLKDLAEGVHYAQLKIQIPEGMGLKNYLPERTTITVTKK